MSVQLKVYFKPHGTIRRFNVEDSYSYDDLYARLEEYYPKNTELGLQYIDEEKDIVTFSSNSEWRNAVANHVELNDKLLRVIVKPIRRLPRQCSSSGVQRYRPMPPVENKLEESVKRASPLVKRLFGIDIGKEDPKPKEEESEVIVINELAEEKEPVVEKVEEIKQEVVDNHPEFPPRNDFMQPILKYATEQETLNTMGFTNRKLNEHLLDNYKGDIVRVVNSLVQLSLKQ
jgi:hypothetical protein